MSFIIIFDLKSLLSDINMATPAFFWFLFAWNLLVLSFTFSLYMSLHLMRVSYWEHINGSYFSIHSATLSLIGEFSPFTFKIIIDRGILIAILLIVFWLFLYFFCFFSCSFSFVVGWLFLSSLPIFLYLLCIYHSLCGCHKT